MHEESPAPSSEKAEILPSHPSFPHLWNTMPSCLPSFPLNLRRPRGTSPTGDPGLGGLGWVESVAAVTMIVISFIRLSGKGTRRIPKEEEDEEDEEEEDEDEDGERQEAVDWDVNCDEDCGEQGGREVQDCQSLKRVEHREEIQRDENEDEEEEEEEDEDEGKQRRGENERRDIKIFTGGNHEECQYDERRGDGADAGGDAGGVDMKEMVVCKIEMYLSALDLAEAAVEEGKKCWFKGVRFGYLMASKQFYEQQVSMKFLESVALDAIYSSKVARLQARELQEEIVAVEGEKKLLMEDKLSSFFERIESLEEQLAKERAERQSLAESELGGCLYSMGGSSCRTGLGALVTEDAHCCTCGAKCSHFQSPTSVSVDSEFDRDLFSPDGKLNNSSSTGSTGSGSSSSREWGTPMTKRWRDDI